MTQARYNPVRAPPFRFKESGSGLKFLGNMISLWPYFGFTKVLKRDSPDVRSFVLFIITY